MLGVRVSAGAEMTSFAPHRLRNARLSAGLTPEHVAIAIGRSSYSVREYELGRVTPSTPILAKLATVLSVSVSAFFEESGDMDAA